MKTKATKTKVVTNFKVSKLAVVGALTTFMFAQQAYAVLPTPNENATVQGTQAFATNVQVMAVTTDANGQEVLVPVPANTKLPEGSMVEYQGFFTNNNPDFVTSMMVTMSIPKEVELVGNISPEFPLGSIDGQRFSPMPLRTRVNGQLQEIANSYYRAVRWEVTDLGKGETVKVSYRAMVK